MIYGSWDTGWDRHSLLTFRTIFCPFTTLTTTKIKKEKNGKKAWRYYHFKHVHHEWLSYDILFLGYGAPRTEFFVILGKCLPFYPLTTWKIKILKKWKQLLEISSFYSCVRKITIIWFTVPEIKSETDIIFWHTGQYFALSPPWRQGKSKIWTIEK